MKEWRTYEIDLGFFSFFLRPISNSPATHWQIVTITLRVTPHKMFLKGKLGLIFVIGSLLLGAGGSKLGLSANESVTEDGKTGSSLIGPSVTENIRGELPKMIEKSQLRRRATKTPASPVRNSIINQQITAARADAIRAILNKDAKIDPDHYLDHLAEAVNGLPEPEIFSKPSYKRATYEQKFGLLADDLREKLEALTRRRNLSQNSKYDMAQDLRDQYLVLRTQVIVNGRSIAKDKKIDMIKNQLRFEPTNIIPETVGHAMGVNDIAAMLGSK